MTGLNRYLLSSGLLWLTALLLFVAAAHGAEQDSGSAANSAAAETSQAMEADNSKSRAKELSKQADQKRPDEQFTTSLFGRPLTVGGELSSELGYESDFALDSADEDALATTQYDAQLGFFYEWSERIFAFTEFKFAYEDDVYAEDGEEESESALQVDQAWVYYSELFDLPLGVQFGRQQLRDKREWWWDGNLEALRFHFDTRQLHAELSFAEQLFTGSTAEDQIDPEEVDIFRVLALVQWQWAEKHKLSFFYAYQDDHSRTQSGDSLVKEFKEDDSDVRSTLIGARARGRIKLKPLGKFYYWLDVATLRGTEDLIDFDDFSDGVSVVDDVERLDLEGWGVDVGATWETGWPGEARLTAGYAWGSGDHNTDDSTDKSFRQTGLQDNNGKFRGVNRFRFYGELLRPELSNLKVITLALGYPFWSNSSVEFVYHGYRQVEAFRRLRSAELDARPTGDSADIGHEIDIVVGLEDSKHFEIELIAAAFRSGDAFGERSGEMAWKFEINVDYNF